MFKLLEDFQKKRNHKKFLLSFFNEIEKNWESWHVMDQRNVLERFQLDIGQQLQSQTEHSLGENVHTYVKIYKDYNTSIDDFKNYEEWYASDIKNKNKENGQILHDKKQKVSSQFKEMLKPVQKARDDLRDLLIKEKLLK